MLEEHIPAGLQHPAGDELEYTVGDLKPGESRKLELKLKAVPAGPRDQRRHRPRRRQPPRRAPLRPGGGRAATGHRPGRPRNARYLEREATYQVSVSNPGTAPAQQVQLVAYLPPG